MLAAVSRRKLNSERDLKKQKTDVVLPFLIWPCGDHVYNNLTTIGIVQSFFLTGDFYIIYDVVVSVSQPEFR